MVLLAGLAVLGPLGARRADAHTFLVRTDPVQGARLSNAPREVSLEFSEAFNPEGSHLEVAVNGGPRQALVTRQVVGGRVLKADLADRRTGVYVVAWSVVADDGHETTGEFAFASGDIGSSIPAARDAGPRASPLQVAAAWFFFVGLALAAGSIALAVAADVPLNIRRKTLAAGLVVAEAGAVAAWVQALYNQDVARQRLLLGAAAACLSMAGLLVGGRRRLPAALALAGAAAAWSARGHSAVGHGVLGGVIDAVHLAAGATWAGALGLLAVSLRRQRGQDVVAVARRYARLALVLVGVLGAAGLVSAVFLLNHVSALWSTPYGLLLAAKTALFLGAIALAAIARRGLRRSRLSVLRRVTPMEAGVLVAVLAVTAVLVNTGPPVPPATAAGLLGPPPFAGPVVRDAGMAGMLTVGVAAGDDRVEVQVFAPGGDRAERAKLTLEAQLPAGPAITLVPRPCGPGCFTQRVDFPAGATNLTIGASAPGWRGGSYATRVDWPPPPDQPGLLTDLVARMRAAPLVEFVERTSSGPTSVVSPMAFRLAGAKLVDLEPYAAGTADDIQALAGERGFRLYLSGERIWVTVWVDDQGRVARQRIVDVGHEVVDSSFSYPPATGNG